MAGFAFELLQDHRFGFLDGDEPALGLDGSAPAVCVAIGPGWRRQFDLYAIVLGQTFALGLQNSQPMKCKLCLVNLDSSCRSIQL